MGRGPLCLCGTGKRRERRSITARVGDRERDDSFKELASLANTPTPSRCHPPAAVGRKQTPEVTTTIASKLDNPQVPPPRNLPERERSDNRSSNNGRPFIKSKVKVPFIFETIRPESPSDRGRGCCQQHRTLIRVRALARCVSRALAEREQRKVHTKLDGFYLLPSQCEMRIQLPSPPAS